MQMRSTDERSNATRKHPRHYIPRPNRPSHSPPTQIQYCITMFARNPAHATRGALIDYSTDVGLKLYMAATEPLSTLFDGNLVHLKVFMTELVYRSMEHGWGPTLGNLCEKHREITVDEMRNNALTYLAEQGRDAQNSEMIFHCLRKSITPELFYKVVSQSETYKFVIDGEAVYDGPTFLKVILDQALSRARISAGDPR